MLQMFFLTRDHLKIMRNAVRDVDLPGYEHDRAQKLHSIQLLIEKWQNAVYQLPDFTARVVLDCGFDGNVSERCLEFAALDRVLYNLINNAVRHSSDGNVYLSIHPCEQGHPRNLRFVVANRLDDTHRQTLHERFAERLTDLFRGGYTTGGAGIGMRICADFVCNAYGLATFDQGVEGGYFGARLMQAAFVNWFHWPAAAK
jgi:signal transduction histidine kinase